MANARKVKISREGILEQVARLESQTINAEAIGLKPDDVNLEKFVKLFFQKAGEMLNEKEQLILAIGPYLNRNGTLFTEDLKSIIQFIEEETQMKFYFFNGILIYLGKNDIAANWIPDRPL